MGIAGSLLAHIVFVLLALGSMRGSPLSRGGGASEGAIDAINIALAGIRDPESDRATSPSAEAMNQLFLKIRAAQTGIAAQDQQAQPTNESLDRLFDVVDRHAQRGRGKSDQDRGGTGSALTAPQTADQSKQGPTDAPARQGAGKSASTGSLWGQIKPCWDALPPLASVPVTLQVDLDSRGLITTPPKIIRNGGPVDQRRLISEARALAALSACVPYVKTDEMDPTQTSFTINFTVN